MRIYTGMIEAHAEDRVPECPSTLEQFKEQVKDCTGKTSRWEYIQV